LVKSVETNVAAGIRDARDGAVNSMSLQAAIEAYDKYNGKFDDKLHIWFAAGSPRGAPVSDFQEIGKAAKSRDTGITMHCAEAPSDNTLYHQHYGCSPIEFCRDASLMSRKTVLAHVVHPEIDVDLSILAESGMTVSHNPTSNCKLGSGISPIPDMLAAGVNVALGTDGAPCNNSYDMLQEMHLASILHSGARQTAGVISAYQVLEMATINGARALGLERSIGSLEAGKRADFVVIGTNSVHNAPWDATQVQDGGIDPVSVVVHSCCAGDIDLVVVDGRVLVEHGRLVGVDEDHLMDQARQAVKALRKRSGVKARRHHRLNYIL
jgi:cytosine/adenosine deaminase-related metal-dependent hydrolase